MEINTKSEDEFIIYEDVDQGILVALKKAEQLLVKKYWKSKGTGDESMTVNGFVLVHDEEQESLKIDFSSKHIFQISSLSKFK
ncbi:MAG: hypothetical protein P8H56_11145 [Crocinitomicaceae bacterium]|nr:hypothetical protein [Crocinitomicaceae bacterium]MDG1659129.1 hypothetical protein [Crocinitomicaceae bacterium]|tara:strand:- start:155 stop:403 length:249 start_codon:yes stop_codon:yes gene_type:complete